MTPRINAFLIHLAFSLCILAVLLFVIYKFWYPQPFFSGDGGWQGVRLVSSVDVILGPVLTLVAYNIKKPLVELRRDMGIVLLIQLSALSAGTWLVYQQRTQMIVFTDRYLTSVSKSQVEAAEIPRSFINEVRKQELPIAYIDVESDINGSEVDMLRNTKINALRNYGDKYQRLNEENKRSMLAHGFDLQTISTLLKDENKSLQAFVNKHVDPSQKYVVIPIRLRYKDASMVFNVNNGRFIGLVELSMFEVLNVELY